MSRCESAAAVNFNLDKVSTTVDHIKGCGDDTIVRAMVGNLAGWLATSHENAVSLDTAALPRMSNSNQEELERCLWMFQGSSAGQSSRNAARRRKGVGNTRSRGASRTALPTNN
jgi:hypothetical protein